MKHKSPARKWRRQAFRAVVADIERNLRIDRREAVRLLQETGADWSDFGLAYTGFGATELGPPAPAGLARKLSFVKDGIPFGTRQGERQARGPATCAR